MIASSELIIREDGSAFHLALRPEQLAEKVILVGDPGRVDMVAQHFDKKESEVQNREFHSITGFYYGKRITVLSTGIGTDNIDIVLNELDALKNIDFNTREIKSDLKSLTIVRIGTCGGLQETTPIGTYIASEKSIGIDGVLNYYEGRDSVCDLETEKRFVNSTQWNKDKARPYVALADKDLLERIGGNDMVRGMTISAPGFYGPQGRVLRLGIDDKDVNDKIRRFGVLNYEMEGSLIAGLSSLLGHKALTVCCVIANRYAKESNVNYKGSVNELIEKVLDRI
ncbi:MAG: nucleoside phosphorylase [Paludibacteraceae bacterium]|nr:nucleoside phosphorylase [Paludibacteraceae bacterium]